MSPDRVAVQCATCGVERAEPLPQVCPICADERQFVPSGGQRWTSPAESATRGAAIEFVERESGVTMLVQKDCPGIGQKPALVRTGHGNILVEVPNFIDDASVAAVRERGGLAAIIASHPHMYGVQSLWSRAFDDCPVYVSAADEQWLGLRPRNTVVWGGRNNGTVGGDGPVVPDRAAEIELLPGVCASQPGGHFPGSAVVHWTAPDGEGVLFTGDTIGSVADPRWVTFMRSFPNWIPLSGAVVLRIADHVSRYDFDRIYSNFGGCVPRDARDAVQRSAERYAAWVDGEFDHLT
ncbi:MAG TPA: MBL fold metallo-hydrolase [Candidatus Dietzia intestinigallinarum]|nr:MBL fold metallo-hydrolase [Candidatus Dietzia intestinigallinarum]